jgi:hypothetical protein
MDNNGKWLYGHVTKTGLRHDKKGEASLCVMRSIIE